MLILCPLLLRNIGLVLDETYDYKKRDPFRGWMYLRISSRAAEWRWCWRQVGARAALDHATEELL